MKIVLNDLRFFCSWMLTQAGRSCGGSVSYYIDDYWAISLGKAYDLAPSKETVGIGSLFLDWEWLESILKKKAILLLLTLKEREMLSPF